MTGKKQLRDQTMVTQKGEREAKAARFKDLGVRGEGVQGGAIFGDDNGAGDLSKGLNQDSAELKKKGTR